MIAFLGRGRPQRTITAQQQRSSELGWRTGRQSHNPRSQFDAAPAWRHCRRDQLLCVAFNWVKLDSQSYAGN